MGLKIYNAKNAPHEYTGRVTGAATLCMTSGGHLSLSQKASRLLDLQEGDRVHLVQDEAYPTDWYIVKSSDVDGFPVKKNGRGTLVFDSSTVKRYIFNTVIRDRSLAWRSIIFELRPGKFGLAIVTKGWKVSAPPKWSKK